MCKESHLALEEQDMAVFFGALVGMLVGFGTLIVQKILSDVFRGGINVARRSRS